MAKAKTTETSESSSKQGNIDNTLDAIRTKFGDDAIMKLGDKPKVVKQALTLLIQLNLCQTQQTIIVSTLKIIKQWKMV